MYPSVVGPAGVAERGPSAASHHDDGARPARSEQTGRDASLHECDPTGSGADRAARDLSDDVESVREATSRTDASRTQRLEVSSDLPVMTRHSCWREVPADCASCCLDGPRASRSISSRIRSAESRTPDGGGSMVELAWSDAWRTVSKIDIRYTLL